MSNHARAQRVLLGVAGLLLAGCGSTVQVSSSTTTTDASGLGGTTGGVGTATGGELPAGTSGATSGGTTGTSGSVGNGGTGSTGGTTTGALPGGSVGGPVRVGPGVTATTIAVGLPYAVNSKAAASALGVAGDGVGGGDDRQQWKTVLDDVNAHGGVLGRKLVPVFHAFDSTDQTPLAQQEEQACSDWMQDHKVFAVIAQEADPSESLMACLHRKGAAQLYVDLTRSDDRTFAKYPYYLEAGTLRMDRVASVWPGSLARQGFFTGWNTTTAAPGPQPVKVGVISFGDPTTVRAVRQFLKPALRAVGHPLADSDWVQVSYPNSTAGNAGSISETQAATLKFSSSGVTHVLPFDTQGAGIGGFFARGADSQQYYPRYGLNTGVGAQTLHDTGNFWPGSQLRGAMGFGWLPLLDLPFADNPNNGPWSSDSRRACVALMSKHGEDMTSAVVQRQAIAKCDEVRFLKEALEAGGAATREALVLGAHRLGTGFRSGLTFSTRYDVSHHDGVAAVHDFAWNTACGCFRYTGGLRPIS
jgi:hypothetical protein